MDLAAGCLADCFPPSYFTVFNNQHQSPLPLLLSFTCSICSWYVWGLWNWISEFALQMFGFLWWYLRSSHWLELTHFFLFIPHTGKINWCERSVLHIASKLLFWQWVNLSIFLCSKKFMYLCNFIYKRRQSIILHASSKSIFSVNTKNSKIFSKILWNFLNWPLRFLKLLNIYCKTL